MDRNVEKALEILKTLDENAVPGHYEVSPEIYYNIEEYDTDVEENRRFESHRRHVDIQAILKGEEIIYTAEPQALKIEEEIPERDVVFYQGSGTGNAHHLRMGDYLVLYPEDAHKPGVWAGGEKRVRKAVFKVTIG